MSKLTRMFLVVVAIQLTACGDSNQKQTPQSSQQSQRSADSSYVAIISCGMQGPNGVQHMNILGCFGGGRYGGDTELELRNGPQYGLYKAYNLLGVGQETVEGLRIDLHPNFQITAQNSSEMLILGLKIIGAQTNNVYFEKQVGHFGVIKVSN